ncbi:MAG: DNA polymerase III subunit gamma/tau [Gloeomargarita sp. SKYG116]|nr:DNA polymerase III subunit gamma/tau [Gloeomargarita sp. SKYG116]MDW8401685.1 DNA polymerase III subunit gamma/tau [Gloeomargarita sp. SKYGB_i_bin116]
MYIPLHHKYRPQTFGQLVGQDVIRTTLTNAIRTGRIAPAYLFTGPRGTGKTSSARILAKALNCLSSEVPTPEPCGVCVLCQAISQGNALDIIEIDAASHTGVDNVREMIERAQLAPVQARYKVFIIDECHMLSGAAFNALLKTLEEPPERVVFVLATTDPQRVPATIISRCQRFDFRRIPPAVMQAHLQQIAHLEGIDITPEALMVVTQLAQGGMRDAESLLDQLSLLPQPIHPEQVWQLAGRVPERELFDLVQAVYQESLVTVLERGRALIERGWEPLPLYQQLVGFVRDALIACAAPEQPQLTNLMTDTWQALRDWGQRVGVNALLQAQEYLRQSEPQLRQTTQPHLWLEVILLGWWQQAQGQAESPKVVPLHPRVARPTSPGDRTPSSAPEPVAPTPQKPPSEPVIARERETPPTQAPPTSGETVDLAALWSQVVAEIRLKATRALFEQNGQLVALNDTQAQVAVHPEPLLKIAEGKVKDLQAAFKRVLHKPVAVKLVTPPPKPPAIAVTPAKESQPPPAAEPPSPPQPSPPMAIPTDQVRVAAQRLADFFNGEVIDPTPSETDDDF